MSLGTRVGIRRGERVKGEPPAGGPAALRLREEERLERSSVFSR